MVATPHILPWIICNICLNRVEVNVANNRCQIAVSVDHNGLIASPKKRTIPLVGSVESLCIHPVNMAHYPLKVTIRCLKSQVVVGFHEAIGKGSDIPSAPCIFE